MSLSLCRAPPLPLRRVRVESTALKTREFPVDVETTVFVLKQKIEAAHQKGEHTWVDANGVVTKVRSDCFMTNCSRSARSFHCHRHPLCSYSKRPCAGSRDEPGAARR
eukprot:scaffold218685_cov30-Tisochrysis_lutea.AAC.3